MLSPDGVPEGATPIEWGALGEALRELGDASRAEGIGVSAGTMHVMAGHLLAADAALDAIDLHVYHHDGGLPSVEQLRERFAEPRIGTPELPLFAGECGLPEEMGQHSRLINYLYNAGPNGYAAVFLWRLEGWLVDVEAGRVVTDAGKAARMTLREKLPMRDGG